MSVHFVNTTDLQFRITELLQGATESATFCHFHFVIVRKRIIISKNWNNSQINTENTADNGVQ